MIKFEVEFKLNRAFRSLQQLLVFESIPLPLAIAHLQQHRQLKQVMSQLLFTFFKSTRVLYLEQRNYNFSEKLHFLVLVFVVHSHLQHRMNVLDIATKDKHWSDT